MLELLTPVLKYAPDLTIKEIESALKKIHRESDDLHFEYNIGKFFRPEWEKIKYNAFINELTQMMKTQSKDSVLSYLSHKPASPDRELYFLAYNLAEQLQDLWGRLD